MAVLLDTGIVYAYYDRSDAWHAQARTALRAHAGSLLLPAPVIPEIDHLLGHRLGAQARLVFYRGITDGDYDVVDLAHDRYPRVTELNRRFASMNLGFVDAAILALAEQTGIRQIATSDRRHFEPLTEVLSIALVP